MGLEQRALLIPAFLAVGLGAVACASDEQPIQLPSLAEIQIASQLQMRLKPGQTLAVYDAINGYAQKFGCPQQAMLVENKQLNDLSIKPDPFRLAQSVRGKITIDLDAFEYVARENFAADPDQYIATELKKTLQHESVHACIADEFINTQSPFVVHDGHVIYPFAGLTFQYFMPDDTIRVQNPVFEESVAEYLAYLLNEKQVVDGEPKYYRNIRKLTAAVAADNMDIARDLARSQQYSDLIGFLSIIRGVSRDQLTISDFERVLSWYEKAVLDETTDDQLENIKKEMLHQRGIPIPVSKDNLPLPSNLPTPRKTPTPHAMLFNGIHPIFWEMMSSYDLKSYQNHLVNLMIADTDFLQRLMDGKANNNSQIDTDVMMVNAKWRLSHAGSLTAQIGKIRQQRKWQSAGIAI